ncbi:MAG: hypothetical protein AVDCRST_MAG60-2565, partial [uncultured Nocardioides sp.]
VAHPRRRRHHRRARLHRVLEGLLVRVRPVHLRVHLPVPLGVGFGVGFGIGGADRVRRAHRVGVGGARVGCGARRRRPDHRQRLLLLRAEGLGPAEAGDPRLRLRQLRRRSPRRRRVLRQHQRDHLPCRRPGAGAGGAGGRGGARRRGRQAGHRPGPGHRGGRRVAPRDRADGPQRRPLPGGAVLPDPRRRDVRGDVLLQHRRRRERPRRRRRRRARQLEVDGQPRRRL